MAKVTEEMVDKAVEALREIVPDGCAAVIVLIDDEGGLSIAGNKIAKMIGGGNFAKVLEVAAAGEAELDAEIAAGKAHMWTNRADGTRVDLDADGNEIPTPSADPKDVN